MWCMLDPLMVVVRMVVGRVVVVVVGVVQEVAEGSPTRQMGERAHPVPGTVIRWSQSSRLPG